MTSKGLQLRLLAERYAVCRLDPASTPDLSLLEGVELAVIARAPGELSIVCPETSRPPGAAAETGFRALGVLGPLDFSLVGVLAGLTDVLAKAAISVFAVSTYDTDYLLIRERDLPSAVASLREAGYCVAESPSRSSAEGRPDASRSSVTGR